MKLSRREFLRNTAITAVGLGVAGPLLASNSILKNVVTRTAPLSERVVVVVNLFGGNDGLNTVIPLNQYNRYRQLRAVVGFDQAGILPLNGMPDFGLNPGMTSFQGLWNSGKLAIINGVGVPHEATGLFDHSAGQYEFQTCDIVRSVVGSPPTGWLGRYLDNVTPGQITPGIDLGGGRLILTGNSLAPITINSIDSFSLQTSFDGDARVASYRNVMGIPNTESAVAERNRQLRLQSLDQSEIIRNATANYVPAVQYDPNSYLAFSLQECAKLVTANLGVKALTVGIGGFDTHSGQNNGEYHRNLMKDVADSVATFYNDLAGHGIADRVLILTISEFGRRVYENNDAGTDHGYASVAFAVGDMVNGGVYGDYPNLDDNWLVFDGNADVTTDFRSVYATAIANFLQTDPGPILGGDFPVLAYL